MAWFVRHYNLGEDFNDFFLGVNLEPAVIYFSIGLVGLLWLDSKEHYRQRLPYWEAVGHFLSVGIVGFICGGFIQFAAKNIYSRLWFFFGWMFFFALLFLGRALVRGLLVRRGRWTIPSILVGTGGPSKAVERAFDMEDRMGYDIVAHVPAEKIAGLTRPEDWRSFLRRHEAQFVFLAMEGRELEVYRREIRTMARELVPFSLVPSWQGLPMSSLSMHHFVLHDVMLMHDSNRLRFLLPRLIKRSFDVVFSTLGLVLVSPAMLVVALLLRMEGGPAFFFQPRVGRGGKAFPCYKFRSMHVNAEAVLDDYLAANPDAAEEWDKFQKLKNDPRITRVGKWIRKTSFDEVPQLWNVLRGDMSLVGPRPFMRGQEVFYGDDLQAYISVRPGITGPWQVAGRSKLSFPERVALEAWYTRNWTFWLDIVIILKTFPALTRRGAAV